MRMINKIIVHCSATPPSMDIGVDVIREWHLAKNWQDVGYHFVIKRDGAVEKGRPIEKQGAHTKGENKESIGICLVGGVNEANKADSNFTFRQLEALKGMILKLKGEYGTNISVHGHREYANKACPSFDVNEFMKAV